MTSAARIKEGSTETRQRYDWMAVIRYNDCDAVYRVTVYIEENGAFRPIAYRLFGKLKLARMAAERALSEQCAGFGWIAGHV